MSSREPTFEELPWPIQLLIIAMIALVALTAVYNMLIKPMVDGFFSWLQQNIVIIFVIFALFAVLLGFGLDKIKKINKEKKKKRLEFENEQKAKGLEMFVNPYTKEEKWGTQKQIKEWEKEAEKSTLVHRVGQAIKDFEPARSYKNEFPYQTDLRGWLKSKFPETEIEIQKGSSRPDIVIGNIAIEVKGPTYTKDLDTLASKCLRYLNDYKFLYIVLFEPNFNEQHYNDLIRGIERDWKDKVKVIRK